MSVYIGGKVYSVPTTTSYNASLSESILVSGSLQYIILPLNPINGSYVNIFFDPAYANNLIIENNGKNINGTGLSYYVLDYNDFIAKYVSNSIGWLIHPIVMGTKLDCFNISSISIDDNYTLCNDSSTGSTWSWGHNSYGELGTGNMINYSSPVSVLGGISFTQTYIGNQFSLGIRGSDGTAWAWGSNFYGELGTGNAISYSSPVSVLGGISFAQVIVGNQFSLGIRGSDGTAWAWGYNTYGQLGTGNAISYSSPVSVLGGISFAQVIVGYDHSFGIRGSDGTAWAWGYNSSGQLGTGNNTITSYLSPVSVVGGISWNKISGGIECSLGIRGSDGSEWSWGSNSYGQLGTGNATSYSSPVVVLGGTYMGFSQIASGAKHLFATNSTDGTGWACGINTYGQLGNGNATSYSSPVSVVGGMSFNQISGGNTHTFGINGQSGDLWVWGGNIAGNLGTGNMKSYSSPVSVVA